jgi:hypothetical protein
MLLEAIVMGSVVIPSPLFFIYPATLDHQDGQF